MGDGICPFWQVILEASSTSSDGDLSLITRADSAVDGPGDHPNLDWVSWVHLIPPEDELVAQVCWGNVKHVVHLTNVKRATSQKCAP